MILLRRLHQLLQTQKIDYRIFLVHQNDNLPFNRGLLRNIGVREAMKIDNFDCLIMQDTDLVPDHDANLYVCDSENVRHLCPAIDEQRYHLLYKYQLGGVLAVRPGVLRMINGFPNLYWSWGQEDDDFAARVVNSGKNVL